MKRFLLGTNWKMHKSLSEALVYAETLIALSHDYPEYELFIIPPHTHLWPLSKKLEHSGIRLGAQNMHWLDQGAYTGEISPLMLTEIGIGLVEIGHSERRQYYNETDDTVNKKTLSALKHGMTPLICIGEAAYDKSKMVSEEVIRRQIKIALNGVGPLEARDIWIAYEPVWAIGEQGIPAEPTYVEQIHAQIRKVLTQLYGLEIAVEIPILYGGSVHPENAAELAEINNVDGLFIGRSAWDLVKFRSIMERVRKNRISGN